MNKENETIYAILGIVLMIVLATCMIKLSNRRVKLALENKCKVILDHDCIEYGNCKCKE